MKIDRKKIWNDPVWSKVIAAALIFVLSQILILFWSLINNLNFTAGYQRIFNILNSNYYISGWVILIFAFTTIWFCTTMILKVFVKRKKEKSKPKELPEPPAELIINDAPTVFFNNRFCDAFPGFDNNYKSFTSKKDIHNRLEILLAHPIRFNKGNGYGVTTDPIWWFRGISTSHITNYEILSRNKVLLNVDELIIKKIIAYRGQTYYEDFVYVECTPDKPTGMYNHNQLNIESYFEENKVYHEEFGVFKNKIISRQEYDDGSAIIKGKPVKTANAKLRTRVLTPYNFIIAAKFSPYNCTEFQKKSGEYFGKLLKKEIDFDDFMTWIKKFPKNQNDE